ncbi:recombinase family protein [Oceanobacillus salinisoli]|uniref:recombinase family protein n=1 Tax=Oceanobacillus salinisoli TaxID=2678611 RepID=UPI0012E2135A|nr:recombinase family protein [Oceanobacillus salinisoli]
MKTSILYTIRPVESSEFYAGQEAEIERYSKIHHLFILKKYSDIGYPATNMKRPALNEMIKFLVHTEENIDTILFYAIQHLEKDMKRIHYVMPIVKKHVNEVTFIKNPSSNILDEFKNIHKPIPGRIRKTS